MSKVTRALKKLRAHRASIERRLGTFRPGSLPAAHYAAKLRAIDAEIAEKEALL